MSSRFLGLISPPKKNYESLEVGDRVGFHVSELRMWEPVFAGTLTNPQPCM